MHITAVPWHSNSREPFVEAEPVQGGEEVVEHRGEVVDLQHKVGEPGSNPACIF